jgi:hypothetical protein
MRKSSNRQKNQKNQRRGKPRKNFRPIEGEYSLVGRNLKSSFLSDPAPGFYPGSQYSCKQIASTFTTSTGLSNVGGQDSAAQLIQAGATTVHASMAFCLADVPGIASLAAAFDRYRIERIRLHIKSRNNAVMLVNTASPNGSVPTGYLVVDRDDATALTSTSDAMQYGNCVSFNGEEDVQVDLYPPSVTPAVFSGGAFSGYGTQGSNRMWLDIANTSIPHYGVKIEVGPLSATTTSSWTWDIIPEYILSFAKSR